MKLILAVPVAKGARCCGCGKLTAVRQYTVERRQEDGTEVRRNIVACEACVRAVLRDHHRPIAHKDQETAAELDWLARAQRLGESRLVDHVLALLERNGLDARVWDGDINGGEG